MALEAKLSSPEELSGTLSQILEGWLIEKQLSANLDEIDLVNLLIEAYQAYLKPPKRSQLTPGKLRLYGVAWETFKDSISADERLLSLFDYSVLPSLRQYLERQQEKENAHDIKKRRELKGYKLEMPAANVSIAMVFFERLYNEKRFPAVTRLLKMYHDRSYGSVYEIWTKEAEAKGENILEGLTFTQLVSNLYRISKRSTSPNDILIIYDKAKQEFHLDAGNLKKA